MNPIVKRIQKCIYVKKISVNYDVIKCDKPWGNIIKINPCLYLYVVKKKSIVPKAV